MSTETTTSTVPGTVAVLGGGRMGAGIAHAFLTAGARVTVIEIDDDAAQAARGRIENDLTASIERGKITGELSDWTDKLTTTTEDSGLGQCELAIEAVPESWDLKVSSLKRLEAALPETGWLASNTSSLSIDGLAEQLERPERFCGLHFFNPVPASKLVEVVIGARTGDELKDLAARWVVGLGKTAVTVADAPGFASSRLGVAIALEAIRMVEDGVASPEDIDNAMVLGYKFPIGPLALTDIVGLDVRLGIAEYLQQELGERFAPPQLMRQMVEDGHLGQKSGKGFYDYS
ncbi:3-hydroxyacyl-CoA dehydrogenase family protein [Kocuria palustris]|uniref:3-hydroxyacyl-CoA dehydrogenase family protein n=1 Tax=Kocuria palustris TaxID=71999 RepID=UPI00077B7C02|nr:3-hydroxyacyl-CoA dehydrogenase family protein [Kocuria palustris]